MHPFSAAAAVSAAEHRVPPQQRAASSCHLHPTQLQQPGLNLVARGQLDPFLSWLPRAAHAIGDDRHRPAPTTDHPATQPMLHSH